MHLTILFTYQLNKNTKILLIPHDTNFNFLKSMNLQKQIGKKKGENQHFDLGLKAESNSTITLLLLKVTLFLIKVNSVL